MPTVQGDRPVVHLTLGAFASLERDVSTTVGQNFYGSAIITATNPINVVVDTINSTVSSDDVDSYAAVTGIPVSGSASGGTQFQAFLPGAKNVPFLGLSSTLDLQNTSDVAANVLLTFDAPTISPTDTLVVPAHGATAVYVPTLSQVPSGWVGTVDISSDQPIAALSELAGNDSYATVPMTTTTANTSFFIPRIDVNPNNNGWTSAVVIQNLATMQNTFTATFYNLDGSVVGTPTSFTLNPGQAQTMSTLTGTISLPSGFSASAVITDDQGNASALTLKLYSPSDTLLGLMGYMPPTGAPTGGVVDLAGLRRGENGETTGIALQNTTATSQTYTAAYDNASGTPVAPPETITVPARARWYGSQCDVAGLVTGAAQVTNANGPLPAAVVELYAGMTEPSSDPIQSTATTETPMVTGTPTQTGTPSPTTTQTPEITSTAAPTNTAVPPTNTPTRTSTEAPSATASVPPTSTGTATATPTVQPIQTVVTVPATGPVTVQTNNGQVTLDIPSGALQVNGTPVPVGSQVNVTLQPQPLTTMAGAKQLLNFQLTLSANGQSITQFASNEPIQITVTYDPQAVAAAGLNPEDLQVYLVGSDGTVTDLPSTVDTANHTVRAEVPHLTSVVLGAPATKVYVPVTANDATAGQGLSAILVGIER